MRDREGYVLGFGQPGGSRATTETAKRPKLVKIDDEMRRWCAALEEELSSWPDVQTKPMFGMAAWYRGARIFAAIPRTRAPETDRSILIKLPGARGEGLRAASTPGAGWVVCEIQSDGELGDVLGRLGQAYESAGNATTSVTPRRAPVRTRRRSG